MAPAKNHMGPSTSWLASQKSPRGPDLLMDDWHLLPLPHWRSVTLLIGKGLQLATVVPGHLVPWRLGFAAQLHAPSVQQFPPLGL